MYATAMDDDVLYGQATDDGDYDDVETYDESGLPSFAQSVNAPTAMVLAWGMVVFALAGLWLMGASIFKGSNQS